MKANSYYSDILHVVVKTLTGWSSNWKTEKLKCLIAQETLKQGSSVRGCQDDNLNGIETKHRMTEDLKDGYENMLIHSLKTNRQNEVYQE